MFLSGHTCPRDKQTCSQGPTAHLDSFLLGFKPSTLLHESKQTIEEQHVQRVTKCADALYKKHLLPSAANPATLESELLPSHHNPYCSILLLSHKHKAPSMLPVLMLLRDLDSQGIAKPGVQKAAELAKAVQRQHNDSCQQTTKQLPEDIYESRVPVAVEDYGWAENPSRVQGCSCELAACRAGTENVPGGAMKQMSLTLG